MTNHLDQSTPSQLGALRANVPPRALTVKRFVLYSAATIAALILVLMLYVGWIVHQPRGKSGKYAAEINALVREGQSVAGPNGFDVLRELIAAVDAAEAVTLATLRGPVKPGEVQYDELFIVAAADSNATDGEQREQRLKAARACFEAVMQGPAVALMDKLTAATWAARQVPTDRSIFADTIPELSTSRRIARLCMARFHFAVEQGDTPAALASIRCALAVARCCGHQYLMIDGLVSIAIDALVYGRVRVVALSSPRDPALLAGLLSAIRDSPLTDISKNLRGERLSVLDIIEVSHTDDGAGDGVLFFNARDADDPVSERGSSPALGLLFARKRTTIEKANEYFDMVDAAAKAPTFAAATADFDRIAKFENSLGRHHVLLRMLMSVNGRLASSRLSVNTDRNATLCLLAVELAEQQSGALPASLESLTTTRGEFPALLRPAEILDPCSGKPLVYRPGTPFARSASPPASDPANAASNAATTGPSTPATPSRPRRYVLYSIGADGVDDGGAMPPNRNDHRRVLQAVTPGFDYDFAAEN